MGGLRRSGAGTHGPRARAAVKGFTAALRNANALHKRNEELVKTQAVADKEYDETLARRDQTAAELEFAQAQLQLLERGYRIEEIRAAEAQLAAAQAAVSARELDLKDCTLTAPEAGVVQTWIKEPGAIVAAGTGVITETLRYGFAPMCRNRCWDGSVPAWRSKSI